eukprot:1180670-Prymnesium_polylepis.1
MLASCSQLPCVRGFPILCINFTPTAEGTRKHGPARTGTGRHRAGTDRTDTHEPRKPGTTSPSQHAA